MSFLIIGQSFTKSYALFHVQAGASLGQKSDFSTEQRSLQVFARSDVPTSNYFAKAIFNPTIPIPIVKVGVGLGVERSAYDLTTSKIDYKMVSYSAGPLFLLMASFPLFPVSPLARVQGLVSNLSSFKELGRNSQIDLDPLKVNLWFLGYKYALGLDISPIPTLSFFIEYEWTREFYGLYSGFSQKAKDRAKKQSDLTMSYIEKYSNSLDDDFKIGNNKFKVTRGGFLFGVKFGI